MHCDIRHHHDAIGSVPVSTRHTYLTYTFDGKQRTRDYICACNRPTTVNIVIKTTYFEERNLRNISNSSVVKLLKSAHVLKRYSQGYTQWKLECTGFPVPLGCNFEEKIFPTKRSGKVHASLDHI